ncbi:MAG: hypothetical protein PUC93_06925, partial [Oscillospiraceae bacterium]|nr:hypothetical protein [Oscillospiraceae bacterium]
FGFGWSISTNEKATTFVVLFHWVLRRTATRHAAGCDAGHLTLLPDLGNPKTGQTGVVTLCERLSGKIAR